MRLCQFFVFTVCLSAALPAHAYPRACATHETCEPPQSCTCTTPARSAGWVFYYYDIPVTAGHAYRCSMTGFGLWALPDLTTIPEGATSNWESCCSFEPAAVFEVDTRSMSSETNKVIIKYGRAPSDYPFVGAVQCAIQD